MTSSPGSMRGQQRQRQPGLGALGADDLEVVVARAAQRARRLVAQRLDEVGRVDVERVGHERRAHRLDGAEAGGPWKHVSQPRSAQSAGRRVVPSG